jgi:hypothetical protein
MDIRRKFLKLTKQTYPYGFENQLVHHIPPGYFKDKHGNYYYKIGNSKTAFTCHLDTACKEQVAVNHKIDKNIISTDGKSILGADDKAGMTVLLYMIEKRVPGIYCFFIGEEVGCIGSGKACEDSVWKYYDRMISFDRRGTKSVITYQSSKRCCSDEFAKDLSNQLNNWGMSMEPDNTGVYTDSAEFVHVIPECTNISVGYYKEHTHSENQDIDHLIKLAIAVTKIDWESLPVKRDPKKVEYKSYSYGTYDRKGYSSYDYEYGKYTQTSYGSCESGWDKSPSNSDRSKRRKYQKTYGYYDDFYLESGDSDYNYPDYKESKVYLDNIDNDISQSYKGNVKNSTSDKFYYNSLKQDIYNDTFTKEELKTIQEQLIDNSEDFNQNFLSEFDSW